MKMEIREDSVYIEGYVNAVERYSKPLKERLKSFVERIKAGVFSRAIEKNDNILVLLNHDYQRILASTKNGSANLYEDNIGLRAEVTITDKDVVEKAKEGKLSGWSFGFVLKNEEIGEENGIEARTVTDLDLYEVSILDDTKSPAYYGTLVEVRDEQEEQIQFRGEKFTEYKTIVETKTETTTKYKENGYEEVVEENRKVTTTSEEKESPEQQENVVENRNIDYSIYEETINKLKEEK